MTNTHKTHSTCNTTTSLTLCCFCYPHPDCEFAPKENKCLCGKNYLDIELHSKEECHDYSPDAPKEAEGKTAEDVLREFGSKFNIAYVHDKGWAFLGEEVQTFILSAMRQAAEAVMVDGECCAECECPESCYFDGPNHVLNQCHWPTHKCHAARQEQINRRDRFFNS